MFNHILGAIDALLSIVKAAKTCSLTSRTLGRRRVHFELLESKRLLTTTLFLDFGAGIGYDQGAPNVLSSTVEEIREFDTTNILGPDQEPGVGINGFGTGPDLLEADEDLTDSNVVEIRPMDYDFDGSGTLDLADLTALADKVAPLIERILQPFDIDIVTLSASSSADDIADISTTVSANDNDPLGGGENDAYVLISTVTVDIPLALGGNSVGIDVVPFRHGTGGFAAADDLRGDSGNLQDELAFTFIDSFVDQLDDDGFTRGSEEYNGLLAARVAVTTVHEAFHTFTRRHTTVQNPIVNTGEGLISSGDVIQAVWPQNLAYDIYRQSPTIVTRFDQPGQNSTQPDNYLFIANDPDIGLRDDDGNGRPDLAYVTGTGAHDVITLTPQAANPHLIDVVVDGYNDAAKTDFIRSYSYTIDLTTDTDDEILIDSSHGSDEIIIDASIAASFRIRGLLGDDHVRIVGSGTNNISSLQFEGEGDDDKLTIDLVNGVPIEQVMSDFEFLGGDGVDILEVIDGSGSHEAFLVNRLDDVVDADLTDGEADIDATTPGNQVTLRAAVEQALDSGSNATRIYLPAIDEDGDGFFEPFELTLTGTESGATWDLDITDDLTIIGKGAGVTVIEAVGGSMGADNRHFHISNDATLNLSGVTLTGGNSSGLGGSILVDQGTSGTSFNTLNLDESAIVNNAAIIGAALEVQALSEINISRSVLVNDGDMNTFNGGGIYAGATAAGGSIVRLESTIIANNDASYQSKDLHSNSSGSNVGEFISIGYNLLEDIDTAIFQGESPTIPTGNSTDYVGPIDTDYVVTTIVDEYDVTNDTVHASLRDVIDRANNNSGADEIWLPAWNFVLTLESSAAGDHSIAYGDLDIQESLTIRGAGNGAVQVSQSIAKYQDLDAVFDLWGDADGDGASDADVDGTDFLIWLSENGTNSGEPGYVGNADADDDGDVDSDDLDIWSEYFGEVLDLENVSAE